MCVVYMSLVYVCVFICLRVRGGCWVSCSITFYIGSLRQGLFTELGATVATSRSQQSPCFCSTSVWVTVMCGHA